MAGIDEGAATALGASSAGAADYRGAEDMDEGASDVPVRLRMDLAYDGTHFHGWAAQPGLRTVEGELTEALSMVTRIPVSLTVAGRTDAGVHASDQVAHVDVPRETWDGVGETLMRRVNGIVARRFREAVGGPGCDVVVRSIQPVDPRFDARFSAEGRRYVYRLAPPGAQRPWERTNVTWVRRELDVDAMAGAAGALLGEHDFLSFCKPREGATTIRTLTDIGVVSDATGVLEVRVAADAFCHSMVRSIVGALIEVGTGRRDAGWLTGLVGNPSREQAAPIAPPEGLMLKEVSYGQDAEAWEARAKASRRRRDEEPCCGG